MLPKKCEENLIFSESVDLTKSAEKPPFYMLQKTGYSDFYS